MATLNSVHHLVERRIESGEIALSWARHDFEALNRRLSRSFLVFRPEEPLRPATKTFWGEGPNEHASSLMDAAFEAYTGLRGHWFPEDMGLGERGYCVRNGIRPDEVETFQSTPVEVWTWARGIEESRSKGSPYRLSTLSAVDLWRRNKKASEKFDASQLHVWSEMKDLVPNRDLPFTGYVCARLQTNVPSLRQAIEVGGWSRVKKNAEKLIGWGVEWAANVSLVLNPIACQKHAVETQVDLSHALFHWGVSDRDMVPALEEVTYTWPYHQGGKEVWTQPGVVRVIQKIFSASWKEAVAVCQRVGAFNRVPLNKWRLLYDDIPEGVVRRTMTRPVVDWLRRHADDRAMTKERPVHLPGGETATYRYLDMVDEIREEDLVNGVKTAPDRVMQAAKERRELMLQSQYGNVDFAKKNVPYRSDDKLRWIGNSDDLKEEGREMNHCVASYVRACLDQRCWIYHFGESAPKGITVEINRDATGQPFVRQALGYGDSRQPELVNELKKHLAKKEVKNA